MQLCMAWLEIMRSTSLGGGKARTERGRGNGCEQYVASERTREAVAPDCWAHRGGARSGAALDSISTQHHRHAVVRPVCCVGVRRIDARRRVRHLRVSRGSFRRPRAGCRGCLGWSIVRQQQYAASLDGLAWISLEPISFYTTLWPLPLLVALVLTVLEWGGRKLHPTQSRTVE